MLGNDKSAAEAHSWSNRDEHITIKGSLERVLQIWVGKDKHMWDLSLQTQIPLPFSPSPFLMLFLTQSDSGGFRIDCSEEEIEDMVYKCFK